MTCAIRECSSPDWITLGSLTFCMTHGGNLRTSVHLEELRLWKGCRYVTQDGRPCRSEPRDGYQGLPYCTRHVAHIEDDIRDRVQEIAHPDLDNSPPRRPQRTATHVYFAERDGHIKIGSTVDVAARIQALSAPSGRSAARPRAVTAGPVQLLAAITGGRDVEHELHTRFVDHRIAGTEWFRDAPDIRAYLAEIR